MFVSPPGFRDSEQRTQHAKQHLQVLVCVSSFLRVGEWSTSASIIILLVFKSAFPCFMEHTKLSTASRVTPCCGVWSWSHWTLWISPVCLSGRTPCAKCVCVLFHWENSVFGGSLSSSFHTYGEEAQWLPTEFSLWSLVQGSLKGTQRKMLRFCLFFLFCVHFFPFKVSILYN